MRNYEKCGMDVARAYSEMSTCCRKHVGVAILDEYGHTIATGYNGVPSGEIHCNEIFTPDKTREPDFIKKHGEFSARNEVHAEVNAILTALKLGRSLDGMALYTTLSPCKDCAKMIVAAGIKKIVYGEVYDRDSSPIEWLKSHGIEVKLFDECTSW